MLWWLAQHQWDKCMCPQGCTRWWMHTKRDWPMNVVHMDEVWRPLP